MKLSSPSTCSKRVRPPVWMFCLSNFLLSFLQCFYLYAIINTKNLRRIRRRLGTFCCSKNTRCACETAVHPKTSLVTRAGLPIAFFPNCVDMYQRASHEILLVTFYNEVQFFIKCMISSLTAWTYDNH